MDTIHKLIIGGPLRVSKVVSPEVVRLNTGENVRLIGVRGVP